MGRVLCISSQTVYGPVGNSAAVPALQEMGHEVMALPTVVLSNHPGHGKPAGQATPEPLLRDMFMRLADHGAFAGLDAVMTGYFSSAAQVVAVAEQIVSLAKQNEGLHILVDPVMGDNGALYVPEDVARAIEEHLLPLATILTPNYFELCYLAETDVVGSAVHTSGPTKGAAETLVTSIPEGEQRLRTELHFWADFSVVSRTTIRLSNVPHGTGDFLAGAYLARRLIMPARPAFESAMDRLEAAISSSLGLAVLKLNQKPSA